MKNNALFVFLFLISVCLFSQNQVGINISTPDPSSVLEIASTTKGVLIPRMSSGQRLSISSPDTGLIVYDLGDSSFFYYSSNGWVDLLLGVGTDSIGDLDADTKIIMNKELSSDDSIRFILAGTEHFILLKGKVQVINSGSSVFIGESAGLNDNLAPNNNVFIGAQAAENSLSGIQNVVVGTKAMSSSSSGSNNIAIGQNASGAIKTSQNNIAIGDNAHALSLGSQNIAIGVSSMANHTRKGGNIAIGNNSLSGSFNTEGNISIGYNALLVNSKGSFNTVVGYEAGKNITTNNNILIGYQVGANLNLGDRLAIDNSTIKQPLLYGNFKKDSIIVNGDFHSTGSITYVGKLTDVSDRRLKENLNTLKNVTPGIINLQAYQYNLKEDVSKKREYGLIAQDVEENFPLATRIIRPNGKYLGVSYVQLIPIALEGIKEQQQAINALTTEAEELEREVVQFEKELRRSGIIVNHDLKTSLD